MNLIVAIIRPESMADKSIEEIGNGEEAACCIDLECKVVPYKRAHYHISLEFDESYWILINAKFAFIHKQ